ncbi:MAG: VWA domain-containing protein [Planctomycetes bacterium]|nr:VWA domain-containing protein [Planctomycetota bacterium]
MGELSLGSPIFLWALLSLPLLWLIHALQLKLHKKLIGTLFLLDRLELDHYQGSRIRRLLQSPSLWLQTLVLLFLTLLLIDPYWQQEIRTSKCAIVVDNSASMRAFKTEFQDALETNLKAWGVLSKATDFALFGSTIMSGKQHQGQQWSALLTALHNMPLQGGEHDMSPALHLARQWVGANGCIVLLSDHPRKVSPDVNMISCGHKIDNVGFAGVSAENQGKEWAVEAIIRNSSAKSQTRSLAISQQSPRVITLKAQEIRTITAKFSHAITKAQFSLAHDAFALDDILTVVKPQAKKLSMGITGEQNEGQFLKDRFDLLYTKLHWNQENPYLKITLQDAQLSALSEPLSYRIIFHTIKHKVRPSVLSLVPTQHELVRGLNWPPLGAELSGLGEISLEHEDLVLVWHRSLPFLVLRSKTHPDGRVFQELHINTEYKDQLWSYPSFVLSLHRFVENAAKACPAYERANRKSPTVLDIPVKSEGNYELCWNEENETTTISSQKGWLQIPTHMESKSLKVSHKNTPIAEYAFQLVDGREGDFSKAKTFLSKGNMDMGESIMSQQRSDDWKILIILLVLSLLMIDWHIRGRRNS